MPKQKQQLAAIMFTDIVGNTALIGREEDHTFDILARNHTLHETLIEKHNGIMDKKIDNGKKSIKIETGKFRDVSLFKKAFDKMTSVL